MAALVFTVVSPNTAAQTAVSYVTTVAFKVSSNNGQAFIEISPNSGTTWIRIKGELESRRVGQYEGVFSIPTIPPGWQIRIATEGTISGTVFLE